MSNNDYWDYLRHSQELYHHGILGMRWGIRRYQNKDGSLTPEGRKRYNLSSFEKTHDKDFNIPKGATATRVVSTSRYEEYPDPKKYIDDLLKKDESYNRKYVSIDNVRNSGRLNGTEYYLSWFTDAGLNSDYAQLVTYKTIKDLHVASGKRVVEELVKQLGKESIKYKDLKSLTLKYTTDKTLFDKVNKNFLDKGYDAIEDINDLDTDMPLIVLNSKDTMKKIDSKSGQEAIEQILKRS